MRRIYDDVCVSVGRHIYHLTDHEVKVVVKEFGERFDPGEGYRIQSVVDRFNGDWYIYIERYIEDLQFNRVGDRRLVNFAPALAALEKIDEFVNDILDRKRGKVL